MGQNFDFPARKIRIYQVLRSYPDFSCNSEHELSASSVGGSVCLGYSWFDRDLDESGSISQINKDQAAMIPPLVHPACQTDCQARVDGAQLTAIVCLVH